MKNSTSNLTVSNRNIFSSSFKFFSILMLVLLVSGKSWGQVSITTSSAVSDNLASSTGSAAPSNWTILGTGAGGTTWRGNAQTTGSSGGWYGNGNISFLGSSSASAGNSTWLLQNNTGSTINGFTLSFSARMWKTGTASPAVSVSWQNAATSTNPNQGALTNSLSNLGFSDATTNILTGTTLTQAVSSTTIANGQYIFIRFIHTGGSNSDNLGWDDVSFTPTLAASSSSVSDIITNASFTYPTNISYSSYQGTTALTTGNSIEVGQFDIRDGGATTDADALATTLTGLTLNVANSAGLRRIALFDGSSNIGEVAGGATATFSGLTLAAADGGSKTFSVRASFLSNVTDNQQFSFTVNSATASGAGSGFAIANAGSAVTSTTGDANRIEVTASHLSFGVNPTTVSINGVMSPSPTVVAKDANANVDLDFTGSVTLSSTGTIASGATNPVSAVGGTATFSNLLFSAAETSLTIAGSAPGVNPTGNSNTFDVTNPQPEINIKQDATTIATSGTYGFGNQLSGTSSSAITFTVENLGTANLNLSGSPKVAINGTNASEFSINETSTSATVNASGTTTFTITFSPTSQGSKTAAISIANDDGTGSENPYIINLTGTGTVSAASDIANTGAYSYTSNVGYASYQSATTLTTENSVGATGITIRDGAGSSDSDNLGTSLTAINFTTGGSTAIRTAALFDGSTNVSEVAVNGATTISFTGLSLTATDNGTKDLELRVSYMATVTDNQQITFAVSAATASTAGSVFAAANAGGVASTATTDINRIEVTATQLAFVQQPTNAVISGNMTPAVTVKAIDANSNTDLDFTGNVDISSSGTLSSSPQSSSAVAGIATFSAINHTATGTALTLSAASTGLTGVGSSTFNIAVQAAGVLLTEENFDYTSATNLTANGWSAHSSAGTSSVKVHSSGLSYSTYGSTGIGNAAIINASGEDINRTFTQQNTGTTTYSSFLVNVTSATSGGDYIVHLGPTTISTEFRCRLYTKYASSNLTFGISTNGNTIVYAPTNFVYGTTYLVVIKHFFNGSSQTSSLYVNPSLTAEPTSPDATETSSTSLSTNIGSVAIRQSSTSNIAAIDGIRVATNWGSLMGNSSYDSNANIVAGNYNNVSVLSGITLTQTGNTVINGDLTLASGSVMEVPAGKQLTVSGTLTNNGTINLRSSASGTATIITPATMSGSGTATVEQYLPTGRNWYLGLPVTNSGETILANSLTSAGATSVSYYNEAGSAWVSNYSGVLIRGKGYIALSSSGSATNNVNFSGTLNNGEITVGLSRKGSTKAGFNLIANPYPSYLNALTAVNNNANIERTIWYRTKGSTYQFETVNATSGVGTNVALTGKVTGQVPPMQAFWVRTTTDDNSIIFTNAMRAHAGSVTTSEGTIPTTNMKSPALAENKVVRLRISNGVNSDEAVLYTDENASNGYDNYDSPKMMNNNPAIPEIYTTVGSENLVINGMNSLVLDTEIPLVLNPGNGKTFTISATEILHLTSDVQVILKDENTEFDLTSGKNYEFNADNQLTSTRFKIVFKTAGKNTGFEKSDFAESHGVLYVNSNRQIVLKNSIIGATIKVFNAMGQQLFMQKSSSSTEIINKNFSPGVYFVAVNNRMRKVVVE